MIKSLSTVTSQKLGATQVITDLTTAVKELIENSLDAGATAIGRYHTLAICL
jgi:DNA mismatch repair protein PMS2